MTNDKVQAYVNNYTKGTDGNYILKNAPISTPTSTPNYASQVISNIGDTFTQGGKNVMSNISNVPKNAEAAGGGIGADVLSGLSAAGHVAGDIAGTAGGIIGSFISPLLPESVKSGIGDVTKFVSDKVNSIPGMTPEIAKGLGDVFNTLTLKGGNEVAPVKDVAETAVNVAGKVSDTISSAGDNIGTGVKNVVSKVNPFSVKTLSPEDLTTQGIKDATPTNWKSVVGESSIKNPDGTVTPRINEAHGITPRTVNPNAENVAAGNELSKLNGYSEIAGKKSTSLTKAQFVDNAIATKGKALDASLANEKILRPPQELNKIIKTAVMDTADKSQLLSKSDPMVKNYLRSAQRIVDASDGTLKGERQIVLKLDQAYEDAGGKYSNNKPLDQIHRSARQSLINDMEDKAQNTEVKSSLKEMENLYHANDVIWDNAKAEGGTVWKQFQQNHPTITHAIKTGAGALKLGGVIKGAEAI